MSFSLRRYYTCSLLINYRGGVKVELKSQPVGHSEICNATDTINKPESVTYCIL